MSARFYRHQWGYTPYNLSLHDGGWRIGYGRSSFLIAEGSGFSMPVGRRLLQILNDDFRRLPARKKKVARP